MTGHRTLQRVGGALLSAACLVAAGCVVHRGRDFGHWVLPSEEIATVRFVQCNLKRPLSGAEQIAVLPPLGDMPADYLDQVNEHLLKEAKNYLPVEVISVQRHGELAEYVTKANLMPLNDILDVHEMARLGALLGVSHMLACVVQNCRSYPPQSLALKFVLIQTAGHDTVLHMDATFDASEQAVLTAADKYLQSRRAAQYNPANLDVLLESPSQYAGFVATQCMRALSRRLLAVEKEP